MARNASRSTLAIAATANAYAPRWRGFALPCACMARVTRRHAIVVWYALKRRAQHRRIAARGINACAQKRAWRSANNARIGIINNAALNASSVWRRTHQRANGAYRVDGGRAINISAHRAAHRTAIRAAGGKGGRHLPLARHLSKRRAKKKKKSGINGIGVAAKHQRRHRGGAGINGGIRRVSSWRSGGGVAGIGHALTRQNRVTTTNSMPGA